MEFRYAAGPSAEREDPWRKIEPAHSWNDLVLPESELELLRAIPAALRRREVAISRWAVSHGPGGSKDGPKPGLPLLFAGEPGTGKMMAARILGAELGQSILYVDIGKLLPDHGDAADRLVTRLFVEAERSRAIVFLDGAHAWLGRRSSPADSGRPTGLEASHLLELADGYPGIVIFSSRRRRRIDEAPVERFDFVIDFPFPENPARRQIWRSLLPDDERVTDADLDYLATSFKLSGGAIHDCCMAAAAAAEQEGVPIEMFHVARAVEHQYRGRLLSDRMREALERLHATPDFDEIDAEANELPGRYETVAPPGGARSPIRVRRRSAALALSATVAAAVLGFVLARATGGGQASATPQKHASAGLLQVSLPSGWRQGLPARTPLGLSDELGLAPVAPANGTLLIGRTQTTDASLLPQSLLAGLPSAPTPQIITLGTNRFYRYLNLSPGGRNSSESVYALPSTVGTILGVCTAQRSRPDFTGSCEALLGTLRLSSGTVLALGPSASYGSALSAVISKLNAVRSSAGLQLRTAPDPSGQAQAATRLAAAHSQAASALRHLSAGQAGPANSALATALAMTANAYGALGHAAAQSDAGGYTAASASLTRATDALNSAFAQLSALGYRVS